MAINEIEKDGKKLLEYRFQPKLEDGTPIGGEQVVYGETNDELMDRAADNYAHLYRKNRELLLKDKLNPEGVKPAEPTPKFNPRPLTAEERMRLSREFSNPEKIDEALDLALEAKLGAKPGVVSKSVESNARNAESMRAAQQAEAWAAEQKEKGDWYMSQKNLLDIASWIKNRNMDYTVENFNQALEDLRPALEQAPTSSGGTPGTARVDTPPAALPAGDVPEQPAPKVPTSFKRNTGSSRGTTKKEGMTVADFQRLTNKERRDFIEKNPNYQFAR